MICESVGKWISILHRNLRSHLEQSLKDLNLGVGQIPILMRLYHRDNQKQNDIAEMLQLDKSSLARNIKKLEELSYISRNVDSSDQRAYAISLNPSALKIKGNIKSTLKEWTEIVLKDFTKQQKKDLFFLLEKAALNVGHIKEKK